MKSMMTKALFVSFIKKFQNLNQILKKSNVSFRIESSLIPVSTFYAHLTNVDLNHFTMNL